MKKIYLDTETCGLHGPIVIIQYAEEEGEVSIHEVWRRPVQETLDLIDWFAGNCVIGFNLAFDWFHIAQAYTTLLEYQERYPNACKYIDPELYANCEPDARDRGCIKPRSAFDLMLHARKTKYQYLMDRKNIYIRKIPESMAETLQQELNRRLPFKAILFEKDKRRKSVWKIQEHPKSGFVNLYVKFSPSSALKALAKDALNLEEDPVLLKEIALPDYKYPLELGYAPFALALQELDKWKGQRKKLFKGKWKGAWPQFIDDHIDYWGFHPTARKYAENDVVYTRALYHHFNDPPIGDNDSILACMVGAVRWKGFKVDIELIKDLREYALKIKGKIPTDQRAVMRWISAVMSEEEALGMPDSTDKEALKEIMDWDENAAEQIKEIDKAKLDVKERHEKLKEIKWECQASYRAHLVYEARHAEKEIQVYDKFLIAGRFHAALNVIGTLSSRMSGTGGLNAQGIKKAKYVRKAFPLAFENMDLDGGDFSGFEVTIAAAVYNDPELIEELTSYVDCVYCDGVGCQKCDNTGKEKKKIHAIFGTHIFPGYSYKQIRLTDGQVPDLYTISKSGLFTWLFAGTEHAFKKNLGIEQNEARAGINSFERAYPEVGKKRSKTMEDYCPLYQPGGKRTEIKWRPHKDTVTTLLGFTRYFTLEFQVIEALYELATNPPKEWANRIGTVVRSEDSQTLIGATRSALYGAAFSIANKVARVAINMPIQGTGAQITKGLQCNCWKLQPYGYSDWCVIPLNIHDEVMVPVMPGKRSELTQAVDDTIKEYRSVVPLLEIDWKTRLASWADK